MKLIPLGISDFKKIIDGNYYYVDKTSFIQELLDTASETILIARPRRFGKTLNLSMLKYFFEKTTESNAHLFADTEIWKKQEYQKLQGNYPVIFLTFKDIKSETWEETYKKIVEIIAAEYKRHIDIVRDQLDDFDLQLYSSIREERAEQSKYERSLLFLCQQLKQKYQTNVIILIDEYDSPIHAGFNHGFYDKVISFMRLFLSSALKDNSYLERSVLTGILRTGKEGIFSGLNNLEIATILDDSFQDKFGFTHDEVKQLLQDNNLSAKRQEVQEWYNGYLFANTIIYNPWSILSCVKKRGLIQQYWVNTSDNKLVKSLIALTDVQFKEEFEPLLEHKTVTEKIDESIIFPGIEHNAQAVWSLLLFAGYLTASKIEIIEGKKHCTLKIPNKEIYYLFKDFITEIFEQSLSKSKIKLLFNALKTGDTQTFATLLQEFIFNSMSYYDLDETEKSYHLFVLGLFVNLQDSYQIKSNRESGLGRYDIMLIPRTKQQMGIVIEFKKVNLDQKETLETAAQNALTQIKNKNYAHELRDFDIKQIKAYGIACESKKIIVLSEDLSK